MVPSHQYGAVDALKHLVRRGNVVFTVAAYSVLAPIGYTLLATLCLLWRGDPLRRARRLQRVTCRAYRFMHDWLRWTRITRFDWRKPLAGIPSGPCVVIANHPTLMDVTAVTAVVGGGATIVKPTLFRRRMIHPLLVGAGHVEGPGADPIGAGRVCTEVVERLRSGMRVIVFPEGTRSPPGQIGAFGRIAFEIACRAGVPLVALTIRCEPVYLSKQVPLFRPPHPTPRLEVDVLTVEDPAACGYDSRELRRRVVERYREWLRMLACPARPTYHAAPEETEWQTS